MAIPNEVKTGYNGRVSEAGTEARTYRLDYYRPDDSRPVRTETVTAPNLDAILAKAAEWRERTGGTMTHEETTPEHVQPGPYYVDAAGVAHRVAITVAWHDYWTAEGELLARCLCGWWDHHPYLPGGCDYADMKLRFRATDHVT